MNSELNETVNILLAFGGSGGKTVQHLMAQMANDPEAARVAKERIHIVLCDTDDADLEKARDGVLAAFKASGLADPPPIEIVRLADSVDLFQDLVSERIFRMSAEEREVMRQYWWFEPSRDGRSDKPFSAPTMPENVNRGAAQSPLVSHFLAWNKLPEFERTLEKIANYCKNERNLENFSVDLFVIAGLAGGTGRGAWQTLAFKAREFFWQDKNGRRACRPIGFFFDWTCFRDIAEQRPEQMIKLQVNSYTGLSELSMWLRSALPADGVIAKFDSGVSRERAFMLPSLSSPTDRSAAALDTERYMAEDDEARLGRSPIHRAYIFTDKSKSMAIQSCQQAYELASAAIYGRLCISQTRSADSNEPERACATATSILSVPIAKIRLAVLKEANSHRLNQMTHGMSTQESEQGPGKPLTAYDGSGGSRSIVMNDADLNREVASARRALLGLLDIGEKQVFEAEGAQSRRTPTSPRSVLAFAVSQQGERGVVDAIDNSEGKRGVLAALDRAIHGVRGKSFTQGAVDSALSEIIKGLPSVSGMGDGVLPPGARRAEINERRYSQISEHYVTAPILRALGEDGRQGGVGPALAMTSSLLAAAAEAKRSIQRASEDVDGSQSTASNNQDWAKPYFNLFGKIRLTQKDSFRSLVRQQLCASAYPAVASAMSELVEAILKDIEAIHGILTDTVRVMEHQRQVISREAQELRKECFTMLGSGSERAADEDKMRKSFLDQRGNPVTKMIRTLRPIYEKNAYDEIVSGLVSDSKAIQAATVDFREFLIGRIGTNQRRTERSAYEFRNLLEEQLKLVLGRQSVEFKQLEDAYKIEVVLDGLGVAWFETYKARKSDARWANSFAAEVLALTGYDLRKQFESAGDAKSGAVQSVEDLRPETGRDILASAAVTLARGCDPFVQFASGGDRRDRATVIIPGHSGDDGFKEMEGKIQKLAREDGGFAHIKTVASDRNYFMLVATADLPKMDFANTGWDGWFSEPSNPDVRKWLAWCEREDGIAPFKTADGSVGLGYVCPKYVRDPHLSARRWKPWVKNDRQREQMYRKWVALAYALLGNSWYESEVKSDWAKRHNDFVETFARTFGSVVGADHKHEFTNPDFPGELWTIPLLEEKKGGRGPTLTRRSWVSTAQGLRLTGLDPKKLEDVTSSMRKFVNWFDTAESDGAVVEILAEQAQFANQLRKVRLTNDSMHAVTSSQHVEAVRKFLREYVGQWQAAIREVKGIPTEERDKQVEFLERFAQFFDVGMPNLNLFEPFDGTRA